MKQKDLLLIAAIVVVSGTISFFVSNLLFKVPKAQETEVEVVQPITPEFAAPDKRYFNTQSVDPTKNITIGDNQNASPFNGGQQ